MEATRSISDLRQYLDKFKKDMSEINFGHLEEIPKFSIPNWPKAAIKIKVVLRKMTLLCPQAGKESSLLNLKKRPFVKIIIRISQKGSIQIELSRPFHIGQSYYNSDSDDSMDRVMCFIIFSQCLDSLCNKIIKRLKKRYPSYNEEAGEFNRVCEAVKKSFEPLIPFVVADILNEERS